MKLYQSFLGEEQRAQLSPAATPFDVIANTEGDRREYELFKLLHATTAPRDEPWGSLSWKFEHKCRVSLEQFAAFAQAMFERGHDCVFINPMIGNQAVFLSVWEQGNMVHGNMNKICDFLKQITTAPIQSPMGRRSFAFCNYFVATPAFWTAYFTFIDSIMERLAIETRQGSEVGLIAAALANYVKDPSMTLRPFIIERLFSSFIGINSSLKAVGFQFSIEHYRKKFGDRLGDRLFELSGLKNRSIERNDRQMLRQWHQARARLLRAPGMQITILCLDDLDLVLMPTPGRGPEVQSELREPRHAAEVVRV